MLCCILLINFKTSRKKFFYLFNEMKIKKHNLEQRKKKIYITNKNVKKKTTKQCKQV